MKERGFFIVETITLAAFLRMFNAPFKSLCSLCPLGQLMTPSMSLDFHIVVSAVLRGVVFNDLEGIMQLGAK
jgi:hypothetical protein